MKRIHHLLYPGGKKRIGTPIAAALILLATATAELAAWPSEPAQQGSTSAPQNPASSAQTTDYYLKKWLDEDVVYIITDEERAAFKRLTSDRERYRFIEQFWARRDPSPNTVENEYQDEYYRRLAYANERFRVPSGKPGWQTDRGRMYILYGPPDEIESHPSGEAGSLPYEVWRFHHIEGLGDDRYVTFIDRGRNADYQIAPGKCR